MDMESQPSVVGSNGSVRPDPEVEAKAKRRRFSAAYKARILEEIDQSPGQTGAILRREALYSSHLTSWRKQRRAGTLKALGKKRGRQGKSEEQRELEQLRKRVAQLERELEKSQVLIDAQKKLAEILGVDLPKLSELGIEEE
jgi:transposase